MLQLKVEEDIPCVFGRIGKFVVFCFDFIIRLCRREDLAFEGEVPRDLSITVGVFADRADFVTTMTIKPIRILRDVVVDIVRILLQQPWYAQRTLPG